MMNVGIIGAGLVGGSIIKSGVKSWKNSTIGVYDNNLQVKEKTDQLGVIWKTISQLTEWSDPYRQTRWAKVAGSLTGQMTPKALSAGLLPLRRASSPATTTN